MTISFRKSTNAVNVLHQLIKKLRIPVSLFTIEKELKDHPDYPSLLALSDCLTTWNVPNEAFKIDKSTCNLQELPYPFIAHFKSDGGRLVLVRGFQDGSIFFSDENERKGVMDESIFLKEWDGIILYAERSEESGESGYLQELIRGNFDNLRLPVLITVLLMSVLFSINIEAISWVYGAILLINLLGIFVSILLLIQSVDANNPFVQNLCSLGKKNDCNAILKSDAAKITSWLSWSEVGMFYFAGSFLSLLLFPDSLVIVAWLGILCLPYTIYSIGYQIKIGSWCILCCSVQILIWSQALVAAGFSILTSPIEISLIDGLRYFVCFLFPIAVWAAIKPSLLLSGQVLPLKRQLKKFKYNSVLFDQLLRAQSRYEISGDLMPIVLGNPNAKTVITMVSNPFCGPCAKAHNVLDGWLKERDDVQVQIVFSTANHDDDVRTKVARHLTALSLLDNAELIEAALNDWYHLDNKKYDDWSEKYQVNYDSRVDDSIAKQKEWCNKSEITATPTFLINGYKLVNPYRLEDVKYLLN